MKHGSEDSIRAGRLLLSGPLAKWFWSIFVVLGVVAPAALIVWQASALLPAVIAALLSLIGLWMYEHLWIKAGQAMPLS